MEENLKPDAQKAEAEKSLGNGNPSIVGTGNATVFRYDNPETIKKHIKNLVRPGRSANVIRGIKRLELAASENEESKPQLRKGQIIFGTVSPAHAMGAENPIWTFLLNLFGTLFVTGEARKYAYLHVAVYAGTFDGNHYVIENGGGNPDFHNLGMISAVLMEEAFEEDASFFIISPPKDSKGNSTRHLVLQRALACLGTFFQYNMRSVSCEVFAMTLMKLKPKFQPIQVDVLKPLKWDSVTYAKRVADQEKFLEFYQALLKKLKWYQDDTILTLDYYLKNNFDQHQRAKATESQDADVLNNASIPWWGEMDGDYESFTDAVKNQDLEKCRNLINKGLNIHGRLRKKTMTAIEYAKAEGFAELVELLEMNDAQRTKMKSSIYKAGEPTSEP